MADTLKTRLWQWLLPALVLALLLLSLVLLNVVTLSPDKAERYGGLHLGVSVILLVILSAAILFHLVRVFNQWRTRQAGSRFTLRLMTGFLILTLLPMLFVSLFAVNLVGTRIDRWLKVTEVKQGLDDAVHLTGLSLSVRKQQHIALLRTLGDSLPGQTRTNISSQLEKFLASGASEVLLLDSSQRLVAQALQKATTLIPRLPDRSVFRGLQTRDREYYYALESQGEERLFYRAAILVPYGKEGRQQGVLAAMFPVPETESSLGNSVQTAQSEYSALAFQRDDIKYAFRFSILVMMVLATLFSLWAAFVFSRRLTQPVRTLVEGTLAVAAGDLEKKLPVSERDDFSLLAMSFNTMTKRLSDTREEREQARRQLQQEHDYLNVVLEHLSSGVITLDETGIIRRINTAANHILRQPLAEHTGKTLAELGDKLPDLLPFLSMVQTHWQDLTTGHDWQDEVTLNTESGKLIVVCRGATLPVGTSAQQGSILVFDDVTDLIQAEHDAAWGEVARRLAHEIKNPLTPIQLSAERLTRKLSAELGEDSASFLKRMTNTIIQQVDNLKAMVNAFSDYARAPSLHLQRVDLNTLVQDVAELYRLNEGQVQIKLQLEDGLPSLRLDLHRMRQLLVNLIKNALEALEEHHVSPAIVTLCTQALPASKQVILSVHDNGPGIPPELLPRLFEPYVTSKHKGTGLGLAIVKKIVEEHGGHLTARNHDSGGAIISVKLPLN